MHIQLIFGQEADQINLNVSENFEIKFNSNDYNGIFEIFSFEMQNALPKEETDKYFADLKTEVGNIKKLEFKRYVKGTFASYKAICEKGIFSLNISTDKESYINGIFTSPYIELPNIERNSTKLILPFKDKWTVTWGGDTAELNYHVESNAQKNAFDFIITNEHGKSYKTNGLANEDYFAFNKELIAPCDGEIIYTVDGVKDNIPGELNPFFNSGNTVMLKTENNEFIFFAHFKQNSIKVKQGQKIKKGEVLGLCGNSGSSSEPHLHFHIQNVENINIATGVKCYFEKINVDDESRKDYSPIKGEKIQNAK